MHEIRPTVKRAVESLVVSATMPTKSDLLGDLTTVKEYTKCSDLEFVRVTSRAEIFRDRHDQRSCKICASCVNFPGKQCNFLHNLRRTTRFTHTKCNFALKLLKFYTLS